MSSMQVSQVVANQDAPVVQALSKKDFDAGVDVRWCPGCGDYAILAAVQKTMPLLGVPREKIVFVSGIGCSSRFPYYMNTYGFHTIHGSRARYSDRPQVVSCRSACLGGDR